MILTTLRYNLWWIGGENGEDIILYVKEYDKLLDIDNYNWKNIDQTGASGQNWYKYKFKLIRSGYLTILAFHIVSCHVIYMINTINKGLFTKK